MGFLHEMLSSEAKISSKRTVGFAAFMMLMASWGADTFTEFSPCFQIPWSAQFFKVSRCILSECMMSTGDCWFQYS